MTSSRHIIEGYVKEGLARTNAMFRKGSKSKLSAKAQATQKVAQAHGSKAIADLASAILGETVTHEKKVGVVTGAFVVPTKHGGNHNYKVGKAFFIPRSVQVNGADTIGAGIYFSNGRTGRNISKALLRPAKEAEIREYLNKAWDRKASVVNSTLTAPAVTL